MGQRSAPPNLMEDGYRGGEWPGNGSLPAHRLRAWTGECVFVQSGYLKDPGVLKKTTAFEIVRALEISEDQMTCKRQAVLPKGLR